MQFPTEDQYLKTQDELLDNLRGLLGGRAAEEVVLGQVSTGAESDLKRATTIARQIICFYVNRKRRGLDSKASQTWHILFGSHP